MKKIILVILIAISFIVFGIYFYSGSYGLGIKGEYGKNNEGVKFGENCYFIDNFNESGYLYEVDKNNNVINVISLQDFAAGSRAVKITANNSVYILISAKTVVYGREITVYRVLKYISAQEPPLASNWLFMDAQGTVERFVVDDNTISITVLTSDKNYAYDYQLKTFDFTQAYKEQNKEIRVVKQISAVRVIDDVSSMIEAVKNAKLSKSEEELKEIFENKRFSFSEVILINYSRAVRTISYILITTVLLVMISIVLNGRNRLAYLVMVWELVVLGVFCFFDFEVTLLVNKYSRYVACGICFVVASALGLVVMVLVSGDMARIVEAMNRLAAGDTDIKKPVIVGADLNAVWNGILDVCRMVEDIKYKNEIIKSAYYNFAPKQVESILDRESLTDVHTGDKKIKNGTMAFTVVKEIESESTDLLWEQISEIQESGRGMMVNATMDLSMLKILFPESNCKTIEFANELALKLSCRELPFIFMHYTQFVYGITGRDRQIVPYIISEEMAEIQKYAYDLSELKLGSVITETVWEREENKVGISVRYIGHIDIHSTGKTLKLYELLETCPDKDRRRKLDTDADFQNGLELMENRDYYLARTCFARVMKNNPEDLLARKYLFECEKILGE